MAFYKKTLKKLNNKWYPQSITVGKPVTTDQVADRLSQVSTVSRGDAYAVLKNLAGILSDYMGQGRTVKLDGLGTFYYTCTAGGNGVATEDKVSTAQINGVRVRFIPEAHKRSTGKEMTRSLISDGIFWEEWGGAASSGGGENKPGEGQDDNPLG